MAERMYENMEMQRRHEESQKAAAEPAGKEADGGEEQDMNDVVAEHGPADSVEIHSKHGKHTHKSKHHDAESAHEHISKAFGEEESPEHEANESPEFEAGEQEGSAIPGMKG